MDITTGTQNSGAPDMAQPARRRAGMKTNNSNLLRAKKAALLWATLGIMTGILAGAVLGVVVMRKRQHAREVVASVNGVVIDQTRFFRNLEGTAGAQVIRGMVGEELQLQFARKLGLVPSDREVEAQIVQITNKPGFNKDLLKNEEAMGDLRRNVRVTLARNNMLTRGITVSDADVRAFYNANVDPKNPKARFYTPAHITLQAIVNADETLIKRAEQELNQGVSFALVVKNYSKDASKDNGGQLPTLLRSQVRTGPQAEAENAFFDMKIGALLGPRKFYNAWWLVKCLDKQPAQTQPFEQVKEECRIGALLTKGIPVNGKKIDEDFKEFQKTANVQAFWQRYSAATNVK